jgi:hypothetical protein
MLILVVWTEFYCIIIFLGKKEKGHSSLRKHYRKINLIPLTPFSREEKGECGINLIPFLPSPVWRGGLRG